MFAKILSRLFALAQLDETMERAAVARGARPFFSAVCDELGIEIVTTRTELERVPVDGPVIVAVNHATGALEGCAAMSVLMSLREDVKTYAHCWFRRWPEAARHMILLNPARRDGTARGNGPALKESIRWLRRGRALMLCPAAEVARYSRAAGQVEELPWHPGVAQLARQFRAPVVPVNIEGRNGLLYYVLSWIHPRLGALLLAREFWNKRGMTVRVRIGDPIPWKDLPPGCSDRDTAAFLRARTLALAEAEGDPPSRVVSTRFARSA